MHDAARAYGWAAGRRGAGTTRGSGLVRSVLAALATVALAGSAAAQDALPAAIRTALGAAGIPDSAVGLMVLEPGGRTFLSHNARLPMNPASVMKVVTTQAALELLGPAYTWRTEILAAGDLRAGRLDGDLVIRGGADPRLTLENLWMLLREVRARGVRDIAGDLVIDRSLFQVEEVDPGSFDGEPTRPYNAGPDAALVNFRAVKLTFLPDAERRTVRILSEPPLADLGVINNLAASDGPCDAWPEKPVADRARLTLTFQGNYPLACGEKVRHFMLLPPLEYTRAVFDHLWRGLGGSFSGRVRQESTPSGARLITSLESASLADVVRDINKNSNNVMARQLFLTLGTLPAPPATLDKARDTVRRWLAAKGIAAPDLVLENGSGLSRVERIAPETLARLLEQAWLGPSGPELAASLPLAGVDGTLKRRLAGTALAGRVRLKTGYLENVRGIAGYVHTPGGRPLAVVGLINHARARDATGVLEALVIWAHDHAVRKGCCTGMQDAAGNPRREERASP
jgi:D-alanyl-D-alanine carboxypeptidase/D-alanyl-D-alanine-endopeptidase (penicillin-binding protein 4)